MERELMLVRSEMSIRGTSATWMEKERLVVCWKEVASKPVAVGISTATFFVGNLFASQARRARAKAAASHAALRELVGRSLWRKNFPSRKVWRRVRRQNQGTMGAPYELLNLEWEMV